MPGTRPETGAGRKQTCSYDHPDHRRDFGPSGGYYAAIIRELAGPELTVQSIRRHSSALRQLRSILSDLDASVLLRQSAPHPNSYLKTFATPICERKANLVRLFRCGESFEQK